MQDTQKKWRKKLLISSAFILGLYKLMEPGGQAYDQKEYEPNPVQQEFIRLTAQKYSYIAFGDTDHRKTEIARFAFNRKTLQALSRSEVKNYFLETGPRAQASFDAVKTGVMTGYDYSSGNSWICDERQKVRMNHTFNSAVKDSQGIHFIAADMRHAEGSRVLEGLGLYQRFVWMTSLALYNTVYGCIGLPAFVLPTVLTLGKGAEPLLESVTNDNETVRYIHSYQGKGALFYGAGHFWDAQKEGTSMRTLLPDQKRTLAVIDLFRDSTQEYDHFRKKRNAGHAGRVAKEADAVIYLRPSILNPDGIEPATDEMRKIYKQAQSNVRKGTHLSF